MFPPGFTGRDDEPLPLIVRKSDGGYMYATTDLAAFATGSRGSAPTCILYVIGAPQAQHLQMVFEVGEMAGWLPPPVEAVHVAFGNVLGDDRKMLRSRSGGAVKLVELLDEAVERAAAAVADKTRDSRRRARAEVARVVGIGAVKYADLSTDRINDYVFDWDRMLALDGNTAPYLQYAHARICSIFRRAGVDARRRRGSVIGLEARAGARPRPAPARLPDCAPRDDRDLLAPQALHLPVRPGPGVHGVLRALPGDAGR